VLNKDSYIIMSMAASVRDPGSIQITPLHKPKIESLPSYLQTQHILTSQSYSCVAKRNSTVMVINTLKTL